MSLARFYRLWFVHGECHSAHCAIKKPVNPFRINVWSWSLFLDCWKPAIPKCVPIVIWWMKRTTSMSAKLNCLPLCGAVWFEWKPTNISIYFHLHFNDVYLSYFLLRVYSRGNRLSWRSCSVMSMSSINTTLTAFILKLWNARIFMRTFFQRWKLILALKNLFNVWKLIVFFFKENFKFTVFLNFEQLSTFQVHWNVNAKP